MCREPGVSNLSNSDLNLTAVSSPRIAIASGSSNTRGWSSIWCAARRIATRCAVTLGASPVIFLLLNLRDLARHSGAGLFAGDMCLLRAYTCRGSRGFLRYYIGATAAADH